MNTTRFQTSCQSYLIFFIALGLIASFCIGCQSSDIRNENTLSPLVKTTRDDKGVWFITGPDDASLSDIYETMGYAVATDRLWQAETYRRAARGKLAEIFGPDQLETDIFMRTIGYSDKELQDGFDNLDQESQTIIKAYVAGFNRRISEIRKHDYLVPFEFVTLNIMPDDWSVSDVLAWMALLLKYYDSEGYEGRGQLDNMLLWQKLAAKFPYDFRKMFEDLRWISDPEALTYIPRTKNTAQSQIPNLKSSIPNLQSSIPNLQSPIFNLQSSIPPISNLKKINAYVKMGSYAWVVSGTRTASGNPIIYSGPQMGFSVPSVVLEGSVSAGGLNVSGMTVTGIPGILIGRTPHHAWSMQVGHAHTVDYYLEDQSAVFLHRMETIKVAGQKDVKHPVYRTLHGPVINPIPYDPATYSPDPANPIIAWKYSQWGYEFSFVKALLDLARASDMDEFGQAVELMPVSLHFCYADRDKNIAYWMSGRDPVRPLGEYRLPQGFGYESHPEWDSAILIPRSGDRNTSQGFYCGWNNKSGTGYANSPNNSYSQFGPFHRAHVIHDYLSNHDKLTFEDLRDLAINIATTDSFPPKGGNPWKFVKHDFSAAVRADSAPDRTAALYLLEKWDGHFVKGGKQNWASGTIRADAWVLMDAWIREVIRLTFEDELGAKMYGSQNTLVLFNTLLHGLGEKPSGITNNYNWFQNLSDPDAPQTANTIITKALDNVLEKLGPRPWNKSRSSGRAGIPESEIRKILYKHDLIGQIHKTPFSARSTYAQCVEMGPSGPVRIESIFPLGESGDIRMGPDGKPVFDKHFFSMKDLYDSFAHRKFPLF